MIITLIICICVLIIYVEYANRLRHQRFYLRMMNKKNDYYVNYQRLFKIENEVENYCKFIKKKFLQDKIYHIFVSYYPDGLMNSHRIELFLRNYLFGLFSYMTIDVPICVNSCVNQLVKHIEKSYMVKQYDQNMTNVFSMSTNLIDIINYRSIYSIIINQINRNNEIYYQILKSKYNKINICSEIQIWMDNKNNHQICRIVLLETIISNDLTNMIIKKIHDEQETNIKYIFVEIKGFVNYNEIFDMLTIDNYNQYYSIEKINTKIGTIIDICKDDNIKIDIFGYGACTIILPFLNDLYGELINEIFMIDPICYPYAYHTFYRNLRKLITENVTNNFVEIMNDVNLIDMYIKTDNFLKNKNIHVAFSDKHQIYTDRDLLIKLLDMHTKIHIYETVDDMMLKILKII